MSTTSGRTVLITGNAGAVGRAVSIGFRKAGYFVRGLDLKAFDNVDEQFVGDICDQELLDRATAGVDAVVHFAGVPWPYSTFDELYGPNFIGPQRLFEACRKNGVRRTVVASSCHTVFGTRDRPLRVDRIGVLSPYGLSKVHLEQLSKLYCDTYGLSIVAVRIGWFPHDRRAMQNIIDNPKTAIFLSHDDARRLFLRAVEAEPVTFGIVYGVSKQYDDSHFDLEPGRRLIGYEPQDFFPQGVPPEMLA